ncbi:MAG: DNA polymerase III subunit chi [Burkholderiaceae bacterium]|nr:DNA polymerase III subunit chi [Burkholderiaceae bacterium]
MTRIDFHTGVPDKAVYACRVLRKAYAAKVQTVVYCSDQSELERFDKLLWSFSALDFLPHVFVTDALAAQTPILLTSVVADTPHTELLINLDAQTPLFFSRFDRVIEVVSTADDDRLAARERYRFYKDRGYTLTHHVAGGS